MGMLWVSYVYAMCNAMGMRWDAMGMQWQQLIKVWQKPCQLVIHQLAPLNSYAPHCVDGSAETALRYSLVLSCGLLS